MTTHSSGGLNEQREGVEARWFPTTAGTGTAYAPEWRKRGKDDAPWQRVPTEQIPVVLGRGVPPPLFMGNAIAMIGLCGYEQAQALAWLWAAHHAALGINVDVRVSAFDLQFEVKARARTPRTQSEDEAK